MKIKKEKIKTFIKTKKTEIIIFFAFTLGVLLLAIIIDIIVVINEIKIAKKNDLSQFLPLKYTIKGVKLKLGNPNDTYKKRFIIFDPYPQKLVGRKILTVESNSNIIIPISNRNNKTISLTKSGSLPLKNCFMFKVMNYHFVYDLKLINGKMVFLLNNDVNLLLGSGSSGNENINITYE